MNYLPILIFSIPLVWKVKFQGIRVLLRCQWFAVLMYIFWAGFRFFVWFFSFPEILLRFLPIFMSGFSSLGAKFCGFRFHSLHFQIKKMIQPFNIIFAYSVSKFLERRGLVQLEEVYLFLMKLNFQQNLNLNWIWETRLNDIRLRNVVQWPAPDILYLSDMILVGKEKRKYQKVAKKMLENNKISLLSRSKKIGNQRFSGERTMSDLLLGRV